MALTEVSQNGCDQLAQRLPKLDEVETDNQGLHILPLADNVATFLVLLFRAKHYYLCQPNLSVKVNTLKYVLDFVPTTT